MKPKELKSPFPWENRQVLIHDRVWYIPKACSNMEAFAFPGWHHPDLFGNCNPIHVEYCSGNGGWIAEKALTTPHLNWLAVEMKFEKVRRIWSKVKNHQLSNLLIICGEALLATQRYFPDSSIAQAYINFPDPWPKNRHKKNRIMGEHFIAELDRVLVPQGSVTFVTDDVTYSESTIQQMAKSHTFSFRFDAPHYQCHLPEYGSSTFLELWQSKGKEIRYHMFDRRATK